MTSLPPTDIEHVFEKLRGGLVPERGVDSYAVGIDDQLDEIRRQLRHVEGGDGNVKFLRGGYGCGKTFMARLAVIEAHKLGFATSFVVVSDNDLKFHRFDDVYRKVVTELGTESCPRGALSDILDRWIGKIEEGLVATGADEDAADFDDRVQARLQEELENVTGRQPDFARVIQQIFACKQAGDLIHAGALMSWLAGSGNVAASAKKLADIKGEIGSRDAMDYLRGIVAIVHAAGYKGLLIVIDEAETILRMRKDSRHKSLNGLRQICDAAGSYKRLLWLFTGTPEFFDSRHGVAGLTALNDRIAFDEEGGFASVRQPQLQLKPFDRARLVAVATTLRDMYPAKDTARLRDKISDAYITALVDKVTEGFRGHVGLVPRQFLRDFINRMDLVEQEPSYDPMSFIAKDYKPRDLSPEEEAQLAGTSLLANDATGDDLVPSEDVW